MEIAGQGPQVAQLVGRQRDRKREGKYLGEENIVLFTTNCIFFESKQYFSSFKHQFLIFIQHKSFQKTAFNHHVLTLFNHHVLTEETRLPASWSRGGMGLCLV